MKKNLDKALLFKLLNGEQADKHFLGNPLAENLGLYIENVSKEHILIRYDISDAYTQGIGVIQGGILSAMLDFAAAYLGLLNTELDKNVTTTNLSINYLRPALPGRYYAEARLDKSGQKMIFASAQLYQIQNKPIANAIFNMMIV